MAADINQLVPELIPRVQQLLQNCQDRNIIMRPNFTIRDPFTQAKLWRQSRSIEQIQQKITDLQNKGANFLAHCIDSVGPQSGNPVTNAIPGLSWHQWGEAIDCVWIVNGAAEWSITKLVDGANGYKVYAQEATNLGLTAGGLWRSLKDWPHVQLTSDASPLAAFTLQQIDSTMKEKFG